MGGRGWAQGGPITTAPPVHSTIDANGVDLTTGNLNITGNTLTIGQGEGALTYSRQLIAGAWADSVTGTITPDSSGSGRIVTLGASSEDFTYSGGVYVNAQGGGSTLTLNTAANTYTYTSAQGAVAVFNIGLGGYPITSSLGQPVSITYPDGRIITYTYQTVTVGGTTASRVQSVTNNFGYQLKIAYALNSPTTAAQLVQWITVASVTGINNAVDYCDPSANSCTGLTQTWPTLTYGTSTTIPNTVTVTDPLGHVTSYTYNTSSSPEQVTGIMSPLGTSNTTSVTYDGGNRVTSITNGFRHAGPSGTGPGYFTYSYSTSGANLTVTATDPLGHTRTVVTNTTLSETTSDTDALGRTTSYAYDSYGRLTQVTYPEGNYNVYGYDARGNVTSVTSHPSSGSGTIATSASYDSTCVYAAKCNQPNTTTDANGNQTSYSYNTSTGQASSITGPPPTSGAVQPQTNFSYSGLYAYYKNSGGAIVAGAGPVSLLTSVASCATTASCGGTADQVVSNLTYGTAGVANNLGLTAASAGPGNGSALTSASLTYDIFGNVATTVGPLGSSQTTTYAWDADRQLQWVIGPQASGASTWPAVQYTFNTVGQITSLQQGTVTSASSFTGFTPTVIANSAYDTLGRLLSSSLVSGTTPQTLTQYAYDNANNLICSSVRMNSAVFSSPPLACAQGTPGTAGPDRITFNTYDAANELTQVTVGYLSTTQVNYATTTYGNNGEVLTVKDGAGNLTTLSYDGYDRLSEVEFPMPTTGSGSSNPSDYESYGYDNNGNLTSKRLRGGQTVTLTYDALNRLTQETFPSGTSLPVYYAYDLLNRVLMVSNISASRPGIAYAYDALGRATSMTQNGKTLSHAYDAAGNRTGVTWPDTSNPLTATYVYDPLNHVTQIEQNGATSGSGLLAAYSYDGAGRRTAVSRAGGAGLATSYSYDGISRLSSLTQTLNSSAGTAFTYGYNPASQVISRADSNGAFTVRPSAISSTYTANGLNQYSTITGVEQTVAAGPQAALTYDPLGRIQAETSSGATSNFLYDGAFLAEEYSTSGATTARYVPGPGTDEPIVVYSGASLTTPNWYAADEEGSIIATADASANETASYAYGPYGEPVSSAGAPAWGGARYRYTGQIEIPGALSYFYKARMYDPGQGRFFQTDPAGFGGGVNLYAYVTDDPINGRDQSGLAVSDPGPTPACENDNCNSSNCNGTNCAVPLPGITVNGTPSPPPPPPPSPLDEPGSVTSGSLPNVPDGEGPGVQPENMMALSAKPKSTCEQVTAQAGPILVSYVNASVIFGYGVDGTIGAFGNLLTGSSGYFVAAGGGLGASFGITLQAGVYASASQLSGVGVNVNLSIPTVSGGLSFAPGGKLTGLNAGIGAKLSVSETIDNVTFFGCVNQLFG
jgi:RHS repeat-associated protein